MEQKTEKFKKLKSVKLWVTIWAIALITYIVIGGKDNFYGIAQLLCSVPLSYVVANVAQKAIYARVDAKGSENEN